MEVGGREEKSDEHSMKKALVGKTTRREGRDAEDKSRPVKPE